MTPARLIGILVAANVALVAIGALAIPSRRKPGAGVRIGLVFDVGGKNDQSFNEAAYRGLEAAKAELGIQVEYIEPTEGSDRESAMRQLASHGCKLVIGVGYIFSADLERLAVRFPNVKFAGIDYSQTAGIEMPPNLIGLRFREHEGSFVVGAIAGMMTHTKVVGFVGGMKIPLIRKFEAGYIAGVHHVCPTCTVLSAYAGSDPKAFADPPTGQEYATAQYSNGADIIFHASGKTGAGVFAAAKQRHALAIGVDSDQYAAASCCVVTSMVKRVDLAVRDVIVDVIDDKFHGGVIREGGLADGRVTFVADEHNSGRLLPIDVLEKARVISQQIIDGKIAVPSQ